MEYNKKNLWTKKHTTYQDYSSFHNSNSRRANFKYDTHGQVGYSYADDRFKVLAEMTEGCEAILNVKLFGNTDDAKFAVEDKCSKMPLDAKEMKNIIAQQRGKNLEFRFVMLMYVSSSNCKSCTYKIISKEC